MWKRYTIHIRTFFSYLEYPSCILYSNNIPKRFFLSTWFTERQFQKCYKLTSNSLNFKLRYMGTRILRKSHKLSTFKNIFFYYRSNRYTYRLLVWWCFCYLGKNLCVSLPAWTVTRIRGTFQSNHYRTFKDPELVSLEKEQNNIEHNTYILMSKQNKNKHNIKISN